MRTYESHTSISMFKKCPKQYEYRYVKGMKSPPSGALILGGSCHEGLEADMKHKMAEGQNLKTSEVVEVFSDSFDRKVKNEEFIDWKDEKTGEVKDDGVGMIEVYHKARASQLKPQFVEQKFELELGETKIIIVGKIDLIEKDNAITDWKTSSKKKPEDDVNKSEQLVIYQMAFKKAIELRMEVLIRYKKKPPAFQVLSRDPADAHEIAMVRENIVTVLGYIKQGVAYRTSPDGWWCSPEWCGYWRFCKMGATER